MLTATERFAQIEARRAAREATARAQAGAHPAPDVERALANAALVGGRDAGAQAAAQQAATAQQAAAEQQAAARQQIEARRAAREDTARVQAGAQPAGQQAAARQQAAAGQQAATVEDVDDLTGFDDVDDPENPDAGYAAGYAAGYLEGYADAKATEAKARADATARLAKAEASAARLKSEHATMMHKLQNYIKEREAALESGAGSRPRLPTAPAGQSAAAAAAATPSSSGEAFRRHHSDSDSDLSYIPSGSESEGGVADYIGTAAGKRPLRTAAPDGSSLPSRDSLRNAGQPASSYGSLGRGGRGRGRGPTAKRGHGGASAEAAPHAAGVGRAAGKAAGEAVPAPSKGKASAGKKRSAASAHTLIGPEDCGACGLPTVSAYRHECICGHLVHSSLFMCTEAGAENSTLITGEDSWYCSKKCKRLGSR